MDDRQQNPGPGRIGVGISVVLFGAPALLLWLATTQLLPVLVERGWEPLLAWFASGALVLAPLLSAALLGAWMALPAPSVPAVLEHLRVRHLSGEEWRLAGLMLLFTFAAVAGLQLFNAGVWPGLPPHPFFMAHRGMERPPFGGFSLSKGKQRVSDGSQGTHPLAQGLCQKLQLIGS
jgi:hypothetical protein